MEYQINHKNFIKNKIYLKISPFKIDLIYNNKKIKGKKGKFFLKDDNNKEREIKLVDYLITSPYVTIDKNERVNVLSPVPLYVFIFLVPALLMIRFGILGWVLGALTVYSVRNINTDTSKTILMKSLMSILAIVISYIILIALIFALNIFVSK